MGYYFSRTSKEVPQIRTKHREIKTPIPCPGSEAVWAQLEQFESRSMQGQLPLVWDRAQGFNIYDKAGNKWIDFTSTIFVVNVGHANPRVITAIRQVLERPLLHTYAYAHELRATYLKKLVEFCDGDFEKAFLLSAGTEATEAALKLMRMYGQKKNKRRPGIICIEGNWHGRTTGAQMMSSNPDQKAWIGYHDADIHHISFPYPWVLNDCSGEDFLAEEIYKLERKGIDLRRDICGFMLETFQGWGAVFYPSDFIQNIEALCRKNDILLTFDEMQAGFARTGTKFGYQHYKVKPDLICCGKGMGGGLALSGVLGRREIMDLPDVGNMSSTHSANPMACAAGIATIDEIKETNLVAEAARKGKLLHAGLNAIQKKYKDVVWLVWGKGMFAAVLFKNPHDGSPNAALATKIAERCLYKGLLVVHTGRESIKIAPPLVITDEALAEGLVVIEEVFEEILLEAAKGV